MSNGNCTEIYRRYDRMLRYGLLFSTVCFLLTGIVLGLYVTIFHPIDPGTGFRGYFKIFASIGLRLAVLSLLFYGVTQRKHLFGLLALAGHAATVVVWLNLCTWVELLLTGYESSVFIKQESWSEGMGRVFVLLSVGILGAFVSYLYQVKQME